MEPLVLPTDLPSWAQVKSCLVDLYDELINQKIMLEETSWSLQSIQAIAQSRSHDSSTDRDNQHLLGFKENIGWGEVLDLSDVWYSLLHYFQRTEQEEQEHFLYFTLPGVIQLAVALDDATEEEKLGWCWQQQDSKVAFTRQFVSSIVACFFLQLFPKDSAFTSLLKRLSTSSDAWELKGVLDYFDNIIKCGTGVGGWVTICRKNISVPSPVDVSVFDHCDLDLCPLTLLSGEQMEAIEDEVVHVYFCNKAIEKQGFSETNFQENAQLLRLYPELMAIETKAEGVGSSEALVISGLELREKWNRDLVNINPVSIILVNPNVWCGEDVHQQELESSLLKTLNWILLGFSGHTLSDVGFSSLVTRMSDKVHYERRVDDRDVSDATRFITRDMSADSDLNVSFPSTKHSVSLDMFGDVNDEVRSGSGMTEEKKVMSTAWQHQQKQLQQSSHLPHQPAQVFKSIPAYHHHHHQQQQQTLCQCSEHVATSSSSVLSSSSKVSAVSSVHSHRLYSCQHHDQSDDRFQSTFDVCPVESIVSPSKQLPSPSHHNKSPGASTNQSIPCPVCPTDTLSANPSPRFSSSFTEEIHRHVHDNSDLEMKHFTKHRDVSSKDNSENASSALFFSLETQTNTMREEFLSDLLGNFPKSQPGAFSSFNISKDNDVDCAQPNSVSMFQTSPAYPPIRSSSPICDRPVVNIDVTLPLPVASKLPSGSHPQSCDVAKDTSYSNLSTILGADSQRTRFDSTDNYSSRTTAPSQESSIKFDLPKSPAITRSHTLPPLQVEIPIIPSSLSPSSHCKNLSGRAGRRSPRRRAHSQEQQSTIHLEPPLSSSPQSSTSSLNSSPNSSFVLPDPGVRRNLNPSGDVEVTADFFIPGIDNPDNLNNFIEQEYGCLIPPPGTNGSRDFHTELHDLISSSSSTSGSCIHLSQCVPSSSGCSHWGSRSGSISSHGTNGSSNDFVEFWYNLRRRSSQLSDASRRSSSSKHSSDFSTDLEDISENFSKHSHDVIEEEGLVGALSEFASHVVNAAIQIGTETGAKPQESENVDISVRNKKCDELENSSYVKTTDEFNFSRELNPRNIEIPNPRRDCLKGKTEMNVVVVDEETPGLSHNLSEQGQNRIKLEDITAKSQNKDSKEFLASHQQNLEQKNQGFPIENQREQDCLGNKSLQKMATSPGTSTFSSPADSAFFSSVSPSITPHHSTTNSRSSSIKEIPPSHTNFSPPLPVQTLELGGDDSTSFVVLESKTVYLEEGSNQRSITISHPSAASIHTHTPSTQVKVQAKTRLSKSKDEKSRPSHIPRSSPPKSSSFYDKEPSKAEHISSHKGATTTSVLKSKPKISSPSSQSIQKTGRTTVRQADSTSKVSNIPRPKLSTRSPSDIKTSSSTSSKKTSVSKSVSSQPFSHQQKGRHKSPVHSPRSRYLFSDVAAPLGKVTDKHSQTKPPTRLATTGKVKRWKTGTGAKKSPEHKSREDAKKVVSVDITKLPQFWHFVNSLTEQTISHAVLEGAEMVSTPKPTGDELSDEVYTWFADKIVHQVFYKVLESLESRGETSGRNGVGSNTEQDSQAVNSNCPTELRSGFSLDDTISSPQSQLDFFSPPSILTRNYNGKPPPVPSSCFLSSMSFKPTIQRQKSISLSSNGRGSGLNKTVSFEDSAHEPIRTGSEGDLSRQSSFHHSNSFDRQGSTWSMSSQEDSSTTDFLSSSHRIPLKESSSMVARIHRRLSKSATDLQRWGSWTSIEFHKGRSPASSHQNLRAVDLSRRGNVGSSELLNRRGFMRSCELTRRGSLTNTDSASRGSLNNIDISQRDSFDSARRSSLTNSDLCVDIYQAAVTIVDQVFRSISETIDLDLLRAEDSTQDAIHTAGVSFPGSHYAGFSSNIFSSSTQKTSSSPKRSHRSVSPNVGVFSRKPMSRESLTNAFLKVDSQPSVQNYERRSSEPCHTSVQLSLEVFNKNRYNYKPTEEPQQTACTDDDIGRSSSRISWRRGSLDNFSFENHRNNSGFKDPVLSRFAEELMKADTSVPELVIVGSEPSSSTFGSRRSSMSGFRDTTLANLESELLNTSFTSVNSLPLSQSPRSQAGLSQSKGRSRSWERNHQARSDSSETEHWFPLPRQLGDEFQIEFNRQHSQGQEEVRDFASFFAGCVVQEAVCVIKSEADYQTEGEKAISLYAENLTDQILRDAFISTWSQHGQERLSDFEDRYYNRPKRTSSRVGRADLKSEGSKDTKGRSPYYGEGARPKLKTYASSSSTHISSSIRTSTAATHRKSSGRQCSLNDSAGSDGYGNENAGGPSSQGRGRRKSSGSGRPSETSHHHHQDHPTSASGRSTGVKPQSKGAAMRCVSPPQPKTGSKEIDKGRKYVSSPLGQTQPRTSPLFSSPSGSGDCEIKAKAKGGGRQSASGARTKHHRGGGGSGGVSKSIRGANVVVKSSSHGDSGGDTGLGRVQKPLSSHSSSSALPHKTVKSKPMRIGALCDEWRGGNIPARRLAHIGDDGRGGCQPGHVKQHRDDSSDSSSSSSSSSSSICSDETGSSLLSHDSDTSYPPRAGLEERKKKKFTRQNAVLSRKNGSKSLEGTWSRTKAFGDGGQRSQKGDGGQRSQKGDGGQRSQKGDGGQRSQKGDGGQRSQKGDGGQRSQKGDGERRSQKGDEELGSIISSRMMNRFASSLSRHVIREAMREVENLPWWRWFPACQRPLTTRTCLSSSRNFQLHLLVQWMAASLSQCPHLTCVIPRQMEMHEAERVVHHMSGWSVGSLASAIREYSRSFESISPSSMIESTPTGSRTSKATTITSTAAATAMPSPQAADGGKWLHQESHKDISSSVQCQPSLFQFLLDRNKQRMP